MIPSHRRLGGNLRTKQVCFHGQSMRLLPVSSRIWVITVLLCSADLGARMSIVTGTEANRANVQSSIKVHDIFHVDCRRPNKSSGHLTLHCASRHLAEDLFLLCLCSCPLSCLCPFPCCRSRVMTYIRRLAQMRKMEIHLTSTG